MITLKHHNYALCILHYAFIIAMLTACSNVSEDERLIYVAPTNAARSVLIEDFTGQRCVNCPAATQKIEELEEQYGDQIIAVAIHSGPFAHRTTMSSPLLSLGTETGDEFYKHWGIEAQPGALINRSGSPLYNPSLYASKVNDIIGLATPLSLSGTATYDTTSKTLTATVNASSSSDITGTLEVWLTEDNITDTQLMADGKPNTEYVHQHVFRTVLTSDIYGETVSLTAGQPLSKTYTISIDDSWKTADLAVIAFVSNGSGVLQAVKLKP